MKKHKIKKQKYINQNNKFQIKIKKLNNLNKKFYKMKAFNTLKFLNLNNSQT